MSASNWTTCPRCTLRRARELEAMRTEVAAKYGQVSVELFDAMRARLAAAENAEPATTLREDYEFYGAEDGVVIADYSCSCSDCGLRGKFNYRYEIPGLS